MAVENTTPLPSAIGFGPAAGAGAGAGGAGVCACAGTESAATASIETSDTNAARAESEECVVIGAGIINQRGAIGASFIRSNANALPLTCGRRVR